MSKNNTLEKDTYLTRGKELARISRPYSLFASDLFCYAATAIFTAVDFSQLYTIFEADLSAYTNSQLIILATSFVTAAVLDVPPAIAAQALRACSEGIEEKRKTIVVTIGALIGFIAAFALYFPMKMRNSDSLFEKDLTADQVSVLSLFFAFLPLLTSIGSFIISYFACEPLKKQITKLKLARIRCESRIGDLQKALDEAPEIQKHLEYLIEREEVSYRTACSESDSETAILKQKSAIIMASIVGTADAISAARDTGNKVNSEYLKANEDSNYLEEYRKRVIETDCSCEPANPDIDIQPYSKPEPETSELG